MKSIDVKSLLIGFLLCATFFLSVGARQPSDGVGTYQISEYGENKLRLIDTRTGALYKYMKFDRKWISLNTTFKD